ncbi:MAG TPA: glycosyltransferase family 4 protein [Burkholderiaceae bacterium]|jgi:glycosyltransferase involved in cell wall biosynthesis
MKVLYVNTLYSPNVGGGAEIALAGLVQAFRGRGQDAAVLTTHAGTGVLREVVDDVPVYRVPNKNLYWHFPQREHAAAARMAWHAIDSYNLFEARQVGRLIDEIGPELIVCHNLPGLSVAVWGQAARRSIPIVQVLHDYYTLCPKVTMFRDGQPCEERCGGCAVLRLPHREASRAVSAVVGVSRAILNTHLSHGMFADAHIQSVVHNARALPEPGDRASGEPFTFGFIGGLTAVKGVDPLAEAFASVARDSSRPVRLLIAGAGKDADVAELRRRHESAQISFVGHVNPIEFFQRLDVCVVPSLWHDPFPGVVYEALGLGVPVIGARRGGIPEMVQHGLNGLLFEPQQPGDLEACLKRLIDDPGLLRAMRLASRGSVAPLLDQERVLDDYEAIYARTLAVAAGALQPAVPAESSAAIGARTPLRD